MHMHRRTQKCMDKTIWSDAIVGLKLDSNLFIFSEKVMQEHPLHEHHRAGVQLESPKIYTACCWLLVFLLYFLTHNQFSHLEVNKNKEVQWKTDVNKCQMFILAVPPELYTESSPIYASRWRQRRTLSYNINTSSAVWLDEKRRAIIAFLNKDKGIWDSLLEKVRTHSPAPS